jgi:hypothetical protein
MKLTSLAVAAAAAGALLLTPALAPAQTGSIRGTVLDPGGEPVPDARVAVDGVPLSGTTDAAGAFRIRGVPPGRNWLIVTALGHAEGSADVFVYPDVEASVIVRLPARAAPASAPTAPNTLVRLQLDSAVVGMRSEGFALQGNYRRGMLRNGGDAAISLALRGGYQYVIMGVCDGDCDDLDLLLTDARGDAVDSDFGLDDVPIVMADVARRARYTVTVTMASCTVETCGYGVAVFRARR